jgi:hypothetical protein
MDRLVYAAYGLLDCSGKRSATPLSPDTELSSANRSAVAAVALQAQSILPLQKHERLLRLWAKANGDFPQAAALIPADWPQPRRALWEARPNAATRRCPARKSDAGRAEDFQR